MLCESKIGLFKNTRTYCVLAFVFIINISLKDPIISSCLLPNHSVTPIQILHVCSHLSHINQGENYIFALFLLYIAVFKPPSQKSRNITLLLIQSPFFCLYHLVPIIQVQGAEFHLIAIFLNDLILDSLSYTLSLGSKREAGYLRIAVEIQSNKVHPALRWMTQISQSHSFLKVFRFC